MSSGYYRHPTIYQDIVLFVSEDDLWAVPASGGLAHRLTSSLGSVSRPMISPDGSQVAFVGREEGQSEIYVMPTMGGVARRLTFMGGSICVTAGWTPDGKIVFANNAGHWYQSFTQLYSIDPAGGGPTHLNYGPARSIAFGPQGGVLLGRNTEDPARWKRYRGGTVGQFWIDRTGSGNFEHLLSGIGNLASPLWLPDGDPGSLPGGSTGDGRVSQGRIFFISDHEGVGNLYSCLPTGEDLHAHTHHTDFYARNAATDGRRIVYHCGADLYLYDPQQDTTNLIQVNYHSPRVQRNRKFVEAYNYLDSWALHPHGQATTITARGKLFTFPNWEGAVVQHKVKETDPMDEDTYPGIRIRMPRWLPDGKRVVAVTDALGEEMIAVFHTTELEREPMFYLGLDIGRPLNIEVNPRKDQIVFSNHRYELFFLDLKTGELRFIDRGKAFSISGFNWSPDGEWVAYSVSISLETAVLKLWRAADGNITQLTRPVLRDVAPAFDPQGRFLYFISYRTFNPVYDALHFELSFPRAAKPYLITLRKDLGSPFIPKPRLDEDKDDKENEDASSGDDPEKKDDKKRGLPEAPLSALRPPEQQVAGEAVESQPEPVELLEAAPPPEEQPAERGEKYDRTQIDLEGIQDRIIAFPVHEGLFGRVVGTRDGDVLYMRFPLEGALDQSGNPGEPNADGAIFIYNMCDLREDMLIPGVTDFHMSLDNRMLIYRSGNRLRVVKAGSKPASDPNPFSRRSGWLDLSRVKVPVMPIAEWRQMYREAWRMQRDQFWNEDMDEVDWLEVYNRYCPLVDRVGSRAEFSDLMWEMQGELGTSHAYEYGGDYRPVPRYLQGYLGADFAYDEAAHGWRITAIHQGDVWDPQSDSPLRQPGVQIEVGDLLLAINGQKLTARISPAMALVTLAGEEVSLAYLPRGLADAGLEAEERAHAIRTAIVKTLVNEAPVRYREWVEANRRYVHEASEGRLGYVHIPDMGPGGYGEFHRGFLSELDRSGLIVDVRYNRGGHVSSLILEKLARRRLAYVTSRWMQIPEPYPHYAISGPMVAVTNEFAGSDGDIFSHAFKLMKLGPLVGKRTWGGVVGISPSLRLVDGTVTTQPEYAFWFSDVGWAVENYGAEPDIDVDNRPQDYAQGTDPQLTRAVQEALRSLELNPPTLPDFTRKPATGAPQLTQ